MDPIQAVAHILRQEFHRHQAQVTGLVHALVELAHLAHRAVHAEGQELLHHRFIGHKLPVAGTCLGGLSR